MLRMEAGIMRVSKKMSLLVGIGLVGIALGGCKNSRSNQTINQSLESETHKQNIENQLGQVSFRNQKKEIESIEAINLSEGKQILEGLNLWDSCEVDIDQDGIEEFIELYCAAEKSKEGTYFLDDGQEWALVVRDDEKVYPLFERSYIQLGRIDYVAYEDYEKEQFCLQISCKAGAEIWTNEYSFNREVEVFEKVVIDNKNNINLIKQWP